MSEICITVRLDGLEALADVLAQRIAAAVAEALGRQTAADAMPVAPAPVKEVERKGEAATVLVPSLSAGPGTLNAAVMPVPKVCAAPAAPAEAPAPAPTPQPAPAEAEAGLERVWSEERKAYMAAMRARGDSWDDIHRALNKMPGRMIASADSCMVQFYALRKNGRLEELPTVRLPEKRAKPAAPAAPKDTRPVRVSYETARHWAGERGLVSGADAMDLEKVNAKRAQLGLSPFEISHERGLRVPA